MADAVMVKKSFLKRLIDKGKQAAPVIIEAGRRVAGRTVALARRPPGAAKAELASDRNGLFSLGLGSLVAYVMSLDSVKKSELLKKNWYIAPLALVLIGYWLIRKNKPHGRALMTLGGLLFVQGYQNRPKDAEKKAPAKETGDPAWSPVHGYHPYANQLPPAPAGARWVVAADGRHILMPERQYERYQLPQQTRAKVDPVARTADEIYGKTA